MERGLAGEPAEFTIVTKDAGPGGLALAVHGPSKAEITCQDNEDGTCSVKYVPEEPGKMWCNLFVVTSKLNTPHRAMQPVPSAGKHATGAKPSAGKPGTDADADANRGYKSNL